MTYEYDCIFDMGKNATTELIQNFIKYPFLMAAVAIKLLHPGW